MACYRGGGVGGLNLLFYGRAIGGARSLHGVAVPVALYIPTISVLSMAIRALSISFLFRPFLRVI